jgi:MYXO-CTERM domain-containing protein
VACQPKCNGKDCGEDGCGGTCGQCAGSDKCIAGVCQGKTCAGSCGGQSLFECYCDGQCIEYGDCCPDVCEACPDICAGPSCDSVGWQGCCDGDSVVWCQDGELKTEDCSGSPSCGWNAAGGYYDCKTAGGADPSGEYPLVCKGTCFATCDGKECGDDGCGGSCGQCVGKWAVCTPEGVCCESSCAGKECGGDGCGGICGVCADGLSCDGSLCIDAIPEGCYPQETPGCGGCGCEACVIAKDDYCGDQSWDSVCATLCAEFCGADCPCIPDCDGKVCGPDGCGGTCGECDEGFYCSGVGQCTDECLGSCNGKECGDDGCGESCGSCDGGFHCSQGQCHLDCDGIPWEGCCDGAVLYYCDDGNLVTQQCEKNPACGWKGEFYDCGTEGNEAPDGLFPISCDGYCEPKCQDKVCGNDGCGGSCGECGDGEACVKGECVVSQCQGLPYEGCCAPDNVLWWCENAQLKDLSCTGKGPCGWNANEGYYNCATEGEPDPLGLFPMACPPGVGCQRDCTAKVCGDDGCMGSCGQCDAGLVCVEGQCLTQSPDESADVVVPVDGDAGRSDSVPGGGQAKKSGGCTAGGSGSPGALMLLFGLLALLALLALRRRNWSLLGLLILIGCSGNGSPYAPVTDTRSQDQSADSDTPGLLDIRTPEELAPDVLADLSSEFVGELKPLLEIVEDVGPEVLDVEEDTGPEFNCHAIPEGPFKLQKMPGVIASEDLAFDGKGYLVGSNNKAIFKSDPAGNSHIFSPNLKFRSGLAMLPSGWLVVNDNDLGRLVKVDPDGVQYTLLNGLKYPNGITIDMQGYIYVTEHDAHRVLRVHSYTGEYTVLTEEIGNPNGIAFNTDYTGLFIGTFGGSWVYYMSISPSGAPGKLIKWGDMTDTPGLLDGIAVDYCGNVYVCEYGETEIYRFTPDGQKREKIVDATELGTYLPNLRFGGGPGWSSTSLYSPDGWKPEDGVWRIDIGVPAPLLPFP